MNFRSETDVSDEELVLDIPEIDEQHQTFHELMSKIGQVVPDMYKPMGDDQVDDVIDVLYDLREFAMLHFRTEEDYMSEVDYPELEQQISEHERFLTDLTRMEAELMNGSAIPAIKVFNFLNDWYQDHIRNLDKPFGEFYSKN